jgi:nitroreductase
MTTTSDQSSGPAIALEAAARLALRAPSALNSQPWRWRVGADGLELRADRERQLTATDPDGNLLMMSCGAALHHALISLAADGWRTTTERLPDPADPDLLARVRAIDTDAPDLGAQRLREAVPRRRTDRRGFSNTLVSEDALTRLRLAGEAQGAFVHVVGRRQMPMLAVANLRAADDELDDPAYRADLARWTNRPAGSGDGVPAGLSVQPGPRRVPLRDHYPGGVAGLSRGDGFDAGASYLILFGASDEPLAWLRAGEAMSALLLTAVAEGLSAAPISDAIEVAWPRQLLRELLAGIGQPYLVIRVGVGADPSELPPAPRRDAADVIDRT